MRCAVDLPPLFEYLGRKLGSGAYVRVMHMLCVHCICCPCFVRLPHGCVCELEHPDLFYFKLFLVDPVLVETFNMQT